MAGEIRDFIDGDGVSHKVDYEYLANKPTIPSAVPIASDSVAGKVMVGNGLAIDENGVLRVIDTSVVPIASDSVAGKVMVGNGLAIDVNGVLSVRAGYAGSGIILDVDHLAVNAGGGLNINSNNVLEVDMNYIINKLVDGGYIHGGGS